MSQEDEYRFEQHRLYGRVRLKRQAAPGREGKTLTWWEYDATYRPSVPSGAVAGDPSKQVFCTVHHVPKYFYVDETRACLDCGSNFVFEATEQRFWYETLKFNFNSVAVRCRSCRRRRRSVNALNSQVAAARAAASSEGSSPTAYLDLAEALVRLHQRTGHGSLDDAVAAARRARDLWKQSAEPDFWEGLAHHLAGRDHRAEDLLRSFVSHPSSRAIRRRGLKREAEEWLATVGRAG
jgi:hypothetical protein